MSALRPPLVVTMGDPAGIGLELTAFAWTRRNAAELSPFCLLADVDHMQKLIGELNIPCPITAISSPRDTHHIFPHALPVLHAPLRVPVTWGSPQSANSDAIIQAIVNAVFYVKAGEASAVVTNPIHKSSLLDAGFTFPGHTEFLGHLTDAPKSIMMLAIDGLRVVPVTVHMALRDVPTHLTTENICEAGEITAASLMSDFGIPSPRLAIAALNPHAGEDGKFGDEERRIIQPAISALEKQGIHVTGPISPDTLFAEDVRTQFDAILCMYHDQALIPLKALDFYGGVNITLGLPIVRTSPDHGTGFDRAGTGTARPDSLIAALRTAAELAELRAQL